MTNLISTVAFVLTTNWTTFEKVIPVGGFQYGGGTNGWAIPMPTKLRQRGSVVRQTVATVEFEGRAFHVIVKEEALPIELPVREIPDPEATSRIYVQDARPIIQITTNSLAMPTWIQSPGIKSL